jgi:hypothetical protein
MHAERDAISAETAAAFVTVGTTSLRLRESAAPRMALRGNLDLHHAGLRARDR